MNRRKQRVLKSRRHLNYLQEFQSKYVLVPTDKANSSMQEVLFGNFLREITTTNTHELVEMACNDVVEEHLSFMKNKNIEVQPELRCLPSFYWLPKLHKTRMVQDSLLPLSKLLTKSRAALSWDKTR